MQNKAIRFFIFLFSLCVFQQINAQKITINGSVIDSLETPLTGATVVLIQAADSTMTSFGITGEKGQFKLEDVPVGDYTLQLTYVGYENYFQSVKVAPNDQDKTLNTIQLSNADALLSTAIIKGERVPILIKKDTIIYNADAFGAQPTDVVEDLLKKLPGIEVERDGTIKAQGETVQNVMVDGKEFFGSDPTIATKNLPADAVNQVQVFDKKSDIAEFTGVDDGDEEKTINLTLKDGKKHGYFGNISAGYGTEERFTGKGNINRFGANAQFSAIGMANNINEQGFSPNEYINFMGGLKNLMNGGGGMTFGGDGSLPISFGLSDGFVDTYAGGLNFNYDFGKKTKLRSSYFYNQIENETKQTINRTNFLENETFQSFENSTQNSTSKNHRLNLRIEHKLDSMRELTLRSSFGYSDGNLREKSALENNNENNQIENESDRIYDSNSQDFNMDNNLLFKQRFNKKGRYFIADFSLANGNTQTFALLNSVNTFFDMQGMATDAEQINQEQDQTNQPLDYGLKLAYTEPLGKGKYLEINGLYQNNSNDFEKNFYDIALGTRTLNETLSDLYNRDYTYSEAGLKFKKNSKKQRLTAGLSVQQAELKGTQLRVETPIKTSFTRLLPSLRWSYDFTQTRGMELNYRTAIQAPSLQQLQPVVNNTDPLNIYIGNPDLSPEYRHEMSVDFRSFDQFSGINIFANIRGVYTTDKITNARSTDSLFRQTIRPVNVQNDYLLTSYLNFGAPLKFIKSRINLSANLIYNRGILFINEAENQTNRWTNVYRFSIDNRNKDLLDLRIGGRFTHTTAKYSNNQTLNQAFLNQAYFADASVKIGENWRIGSTLDYTLYSQESYGNSDKVALLSAFVSTFIFKKKGQIRLSGFDLLNQNIGINRQSDLNYLEEVRINSLARYFMLTFSYSLQGFDKKSGFEVSFDR